MGKKGGGIDWEGIRWGTLTAWLKKHRTSIARKYGDPFRSDGKLSKVVLKKLYRDDEFLKKLAGSKYKLIKRKIHFYIHIIRK